MLAIDGGKPAITGSMRAFHTIGPEERSAVLAAMDGGPLSGFIGGGEHGGIRVSSLEQRFCEIFGVKHAVAVNSATSGLLVASMACGVGPKTEVLTTPYTMSATAAAPRFLGADIKFGDVDPDTFNLNHWPVLHHGKAVIVTNLFGHPAQLHDMRAIAHQKKLYLIEDNAQGIFSKEGGKYAGTIGHIGVFSFNIHKHLQCGEGGICVTNDDGLAYHMRMARNHGELAGGPIVGLNLRMTELEAAIALAQLSKRSEIMAGRIKFANKLTNLAHQFLPDCQPPIVKAGCEHGFYCWALKVPYDRDWFVRAMNAEGFPIKAGYVAPLYRLKAFEKYKAHCPVTEALEDNTLCLFEVCAYDPGRNHMKMIWEAFEKVGEAYAKRVRGREEQIQGAREGVAEVDA